MPKPRIHAFCKSFAAARYCVAFCDSLTRSASSAAEALETLADAPPGELPDVLVSDIAMPLEDGYDLIRKVRMLSPEHGGQIKAIALTAYARFEDRMHTLAAGFQMHVAKPVEPAELIMVIVSLVSRPKHLRD